VIVAELTTRDQATLAERFIDVPWCVYAQGLDEVAYCEHAPFDHLPTRGRCIAPFDEARAIAFAEGLRTAADAAATLPGVTIPEITAYVLFHGIVWARR
jgi:hypothetical protein